VPETVKKERWERFMETQQAISATRLQRKVGRELEVLVDGSEGENALGRSYADAPEIDGVVIIEGAAGLAPGSRVKVEVTAADEYDLWAELK